MHSGSQLLLDPPFTCFNFQRVKTVHKCSISEKNLVAKKIKALDQ